MRKHQLAAMILSALSAGVLISCAKTAENSNDIKNVNTNVQAKANDSAQQEANSTQDTEQAVETEALNPEMTNAYLNNTAESQILPAYQNVAEQSSQLNVLATEHCKAGKVDAEKLELLRVQWLALAKAWAKAEIVNFGPAMDSMSNLYINYYPDERGLVHQGVIDLIEANPQLTPEQLAQESAVVQGIPGLEEVLYANDSLDAGQCQYVISSSKALSQRLDEVQQTWQQSPTQLLSGDDNDAVLGMNRWINSLLSLVETTKSSGLDQPLGLTGSKKGHLPAAGAGKSRDIITSKVTSLTTALTDPKLAVILVDKGQGAVSDELLAVLSETSTLLAKLPEDIANASPEQQQDLYDKLTKLTQVIKHKLMPALGVQVGFNSTDGD